jgi:putative glutamine amidotransferase
VGGLLGDRVEVATYHHQGVETYPGLVPTAWSDDGVVEALEAPDSRFRLGVQWHPEAGDDPRLFEALVAASSA